MNVKVPQHIQDLKSYNPGKTVSELVKQYNLGEIAVLWNNENNFGTSPKAVEAMQAVLKDSYLYPDPLSMKLREKIARQIGKNSQNIVVGNGSEGLLMNIFKAFCKDDDQILTSEGTFVITYVWSQINDLDCKKVPMTLDYRYDAEGIVNAVDDNTKIVYLANSNNPTGSMITKAELRFIMENVPPHVLVIADEAYFEYSVVLSDEFADSTKFDYPNLITLRTFSKAYGIAGVRVGYAIGDEKIISTLLKVKLTFEPSNVAQAAGIGALKDDEFLQKTVGNNSKGLAFLYQNLDRLGVKYIPSYANFVMIDFEDEKKASRITQNLLERGVFVRLLPAFRLPHCIRVSVGLPEENELFIRKLEEVI